MQPGRLVHAMASLQHAHRHQKHTWIHPVSCHPGRSPAARRLLRRRLWQWPRVLSAAVASLMSPFLGNHAGRWFLGLGWRPRAR